MNTLTLALALCVALGGLAVALNHCYARLALVELTLNEGLPPGHQPSVPGDRAAADAIGSQDVAGLLDAGIHVFLSRNCHACQRLVEELGHVELQHDTALHLRYIDRPRPVASEVASRQDAGLHVEQAEVAAIVGADPLPFTVAVGDHALVSRSVTPTVVQLVATARDGGIAIDVQTSGYGG